MFSFCVFVPFPNESNDTWRLNALWIPLDSVWSLLFVMDSIPTMWQISSNWVLVLWLSPQSTRHSNQKTQVLESESFPKKTWKHQLQDLNKRKASERLYGRRLFFWLKNRPVDKAPKGSLVEFDAASETWAPYDPVELLDDHMETTSGTVFFVFWRHLCGFSLQEKHPNRPTKETDMPRGPIIAHPWSNFDSKAATTSQN